MFFNWTKNILLKPSLVRSYRVERKGLWRERLSLAYATFGCLAFIVVTYSVFRGKSDWVEYYGLVSEEEKKIPAAIQWAPVLGIKNAKVYRYSGLTKVSEYDIKEEGNNTTPEVKVDDEV